MTNRRTSGGNAPASENASESGANAGESGDEKGVRSDIGLEALAEKSLGARGVDIGRVKEVTANREAASRAVAELANAPAAAGRTGRERKRRTFEAAGIPEEDATDEVYSPDDGAGFLRDIGEAGLPPDPMISLPVLESVIGEDSRQRVARTTDFPFSAIASLEITAKDGSLWVGTGWFIGPRTVITAGHCVFVHSPQIPEASGWVRSIRVIPGRDGASRPLGSVVATTFRSVAGWTQRGDHEFDYGAILLPAESDIGTRVGRYFEYQAFTDEQLLMQLLNVAGYPGDKSGEERGTCWIDAKRTASVTANKVYYDLDTMGGQSGAPVFVKVNESRVALGVHAYGVSGTVRNNSGTRINERVKQRLDVWKNL